MPVKGYCITKILEINNDKSQKKSMLSISCTPGYVGKLSDSSEDLVRDDVDIIYKNRYDIVLCLLTWEEMEKLNMMKYPKFLKDKGILFLHLPIFDGYIPSISEMKPVVNKLVHKLLSGNNILIHCRCGYGRAGTIAACILLHFNYTSINAIKLIRDRRDKAIQTKHQEQFISKYENYLKISG